MPGASSSSSTALLPPVVLLLAGNASLQPPFAAARDSLVFVHIPKAGGSSFQERLTLHVTADGSGCTCKEVLHPYYHNGHTLDTPGICFCPRTPWNETSVWQQGPHSQELGENWLWTASTTRWLGGLIDSSKWTGGLSHTPLSLTQDDIKARQYAEQQHANSRTTPDPTARVLFAALLREPRQRFISEFYETLDGWFGEAGHNTPQEGRLLWRENLAMYRQPGEQRTAGKTCAEQVYSALGDDAPTNFTADLHAEYNIDKMPVAEFDKLFAPWLNCTRNMAADRQTRVFAYGQDAAAARLCTPSLPEAECDLRVATDVLTHTVSYVGLNEERDSSERLLRAQFGLTLNESTAAGGGHASKGIEGGQGEHAADTSAYITYEALAPELQAKIDALNSNDLKLYEYARKLFAERLQAFGIVDGTRGRR